MRRFPSSRNSRAGFAYEEQHPELAGRKTSHVGFVWLYLQRVRVMMTIHVIKRMTADETSRCKLKLGVDGQKHANGELMITCLLNEVFRYLV